MLNLNQQIFKQIEQAKSILIVFPMDWEADAVSASLSLMLVLKKLDKTIEIVASGSRQKANSLSFLPGYLDIKDKIEHLRRFIVSLDISKTKVSQIKYVVENDQLNFIISPKDGWFETKDISFKAGEFKYDLIISVGADDLESLGEIYDKNIEFFYKTTIINIACRASNEGFGQINFVDLSSVAISELVYKLIKSRDGVLLDENVATALLAGIILKTKNFKTGNLTPETLLITSELISLGARREEIINQVYRQRQISDLKLWGKILNNLKLDSGRKLAWSYLKLGEHPDNNHETAIKDVAEELIANLPDIKNLLIMKENNNSVIQIFSFSFGGLDATKVISLHSPQGNREYAQAIAKSPLEKLLTETINHVGQELDKIKL